MGGGRDVPPGCMGWGDPAALAQGEKNLKNWYFHLGPILVSSPAPQSCPKPRVMLSTAGAAPHHRPLVPVPFPTFIPPKPRLSSPLPLSARRVAGGWAPFLSGRRETAAGRATTAPATATPTASTPSPSAAPPRTATSPGTWRSAPPPWPPPTAAAPFTSGKS